MFLWITSGSTQFVKGTFYMDFDLKRSLKRQKIAGLVFGDKIYLQMGFVMRKSCLQGLQPGKAQTSLLSDGN